MRSWTRAHIYVVARARKRAKKRTSRMNSEAARQALGLGKQTEMLLTLALLN